MPYYQTKIERNADGSSSSLSFVSEGPAAKHLGRMNFRAFQYLHIKTNIPMGAHMLFFTASGYMYNNGNIFGVLGCYPFTNVDGILNIFVNNLGGTTIETAYKSTDNFTCLRFNRGSTEYTEGRFDLLLSGHSNANYEPFVITNWTLTNTASAQY
jgi:hypothetical protein